MGRLLTFLIGCKLCSTATLSGLVACLFVLSACSSPVPQSTVPAADQKVDPATKESITDPGLEFGQPAVRFGILAIDGARSVHSRYAPLVEYLATEVGRPFELVVLNQESQFTKVDAGTVDFVMSNPLASVQIQKQHDTDFLVTLQRPNTGAKFSALIITRHDSSIQTLSDLRGKKVACVDFKTAAAGCLFQMFHLMENDIDPFQEFSSFVENPSQDNIVLGVLNGTIDAGFIRTGQLEKMVKSGLIQNMDDIRILEPQSDDFFFTHTTALYPEWPIAAVNGTDPALAKTVQTSLLEMSSEHPALLSANLAGFTQPEGYESIDRLLESLSLD